MVALSQSVNERWTDRHTQEVNTPDKDHDLPSHRRRAKGHDNYDDGEDE